MHDKAIKRAALQEKQWEFGMLQKAALEPALHNTQNILKEKYSSAQSGAQYVAPIIKELEKRV